MSNIKIKVDFGNGVRRRYELTEARSGRHDRPHDWTIEFCRPEFGEVFIANKKYRPLADKKKFNLEKYIREKCELRKKRP